MEKTLERERLQEASLYAPRHRDDIDRLAGVRRARRRFGNVRHRIQDRGVARQFVEKLNRPGGRHGRGPLTNGAEGAERLSGLR